MGCGSSNTLHNEISSQIEKNEQNNKIQNNNNNDNNNKNEETKKILENKNNEENKTILTSQNVILPENSILNNIYINYQFEFNPIEENNQSKQNNNILIYTAKYNPNGSTFIYCDKSKHFESETTEFRETPNKLSLYYSKGVKSSIFLNQDKFFLLIDGDFEIYCLIDGHGPFGDIIAQIVQDKIFQYFTKKENKKLKENYESIFKNLYNDLQDYLIKNDEENGNENNYDSILSGVSITIIINKEKELFCSNIGNVTAFIFHVDKKNPSQLGIDILTIDDSDLQNSKNHMMNTYYDMYNIHGFYDIEEERRRIYENGGEIRTIAEEPKQRIFVKGQYYPGVINTRSIGDRIASCIGVINQPHISKRELDSKNINYLVIYSDGIGISCEPEDIVNIIRGRVDNPHSSIYSIVDQAQNFFGDVNYLPDMTIIMKVIE